MVESDAPFMGFKKREPAAINTLDIRRQGKQGRRKGGGSEPADCIDIARELGRVMGVSHEEACEATTSAACSFFGITR